MSPAQSALTVYATLRRAGERLGLSQSELADRIGCSRTHINRVINGREAMSADRLFRWADAVGMRIEANALQVME